MTWGGHEEWRDRWERSPGHTRRRVARAVREGRVLSNPAEAVLAVGLALQLLHRHRWMLLVIPWSGGLLAVAAMIALQTHPAPTWALAAGATAGVWLHRLLFAGPRLRRAYEGNLRLTRRVVAGARQLREGISGPMTAP